MPDDYSPPLALAVLSGVFLGLGALCALIVAVDMLWRRVWERKMKVMIPMQVKSTHPHLWTRTKRDPPSRYIITATYLGPLQLYTYFRFGRPSKPQLGGVSENGSQTSGPKDPERTDSDRNHEDYSAHHDLDESERAAADPSNPTRESAMAARRQEMGGGEPPMYVYLLASVSHCGAGCVLGDTIGSWIVYGSHATINHQEVWVELLVDFVFALSFSLIFHYFTVAQETGHYGPSSLLQAARADVLSVMCFEAGVFAWIVAFQVGIFDYKLDMATWTFWWMMQIAMVLGYVTAMPMNYFLIRSGWKEPCV